MIDDLVSHLEWISTNRDSVQVPEGATAKVCFSVVAMQGRRAMDRMMTGRWWTEETDVV